MPQNFDISFPETSYVGMNNKFPSHLLPRGVFRRIENAFIDNNSLVKRGGTTAIAASLGSFRFAGGTAYEPSGSSKRVIVCRDGASNAQLYVWTGSGAFSAIGTANLTNGLIMNFVIAANRLFGFDGTEVVDVDTANTVTKNRATVPIGQFAFWFHNYLFVAGVAGNPNRLYWSALGDPTTFDALDFVDINANDGDMISGLNILNDQLVVFKNYSTWAIGGFSGTTFDVTTRAGENTQLRGAGVGTPSHQSIVSVGRDLFYLSFLGTVPYVRSYNQTVFSATVEQGIVSDELQNTMNGLNKADLEKSAGIFDGRYLYWSLPNGASETNNLIITLTTGQKIQTRLGSMNPWVIFTGSNIGQFFISTISGRARVYGTDSATTGKVYLFNDTSSYSDNGTPVTLTVETRDYMGDTAKQAKWVYLYLKYLSGTAGTLDVSARINQAADYTLQETIDMAGNSPGLGPSGSFTLGVSVLGGATITQDRVTLGSLTGDLLGIKFVEDSANACTIYDYQVLAQKKGYRSN